ncbi:MAG: DNA polymerase III subunit delta' C-terminal domain-containing protein, partial [bacterium]
YIIDPANRPGLQEDAGNALLLTLEEPPSYVVMILISSRPSAVLPTLTSRCRPVRLQLASRPVVEEALRVHGNLSEEQVITIAGMAAGRVGWALAVGTNPAALQTRQSLLTDVGTYYAQGRRSALRLAETLHLLATGVDLSTEASADDAKARTTADRQVRRNLPELLDITASWWRDMLLVEMGQGDMIINLDFANDIKRNAGRHTAPELRRGLQTILKTKRLIERNVNIDLALESMWMNILPA